MTAINWDLFAARVQAGTQVRCFPTEEERFYGKTEWGGILLDNRPCPEEEVERARNRNTQILKEAYEWYEANPVLKFQDFDVGEWDHNRFDPLWDSVKFLIDGRWKSFAQIMA